MRVSTGRRHSWAVFVFLVLGICLTAPALIPGLARATQPVGQVTDLTGPATVLRAGDPMALRRGAPIYPEDTLRTLADSKLEVTFEDGTTLVLGAGSKVSVASYVPGGGNADGSAQSAQGGVGEVVLSVAEGVLRVLIGPIGGFGRFDVRTANVVASARMTEWITGVSDDGDDTSVFVLKGRVAVAAAGEEVLLRPGEGTDVFRNAPPMPAVHWGEARVAEILARTTLR